MQTTISPEMVFFGFLILAAGVVIYYFYYLNKKEPQSDKQAYHLALKYMAEGENRLAVEKLKETVRDDSLNVDAYIKLGVILRQEKLYNNAIRIHKDLLLRGSLNDDLRLEIEKHLALDYWQAGDFEKAIPYFEKLKTRRSYFEWVSGYLIQHYENTDQWDKAFNLFKQTSAGKSETGSQRLAAYKVLMGMERAKNNSGKEARVLFKDAIKLHKQCAAAYMYIGDSYMAEDRTSDAINAWTDLCKKIPENAHLVFKRLEKAWYEKGQFSKIEELYTNLLTNDSDNVHALLALSDIYSKKGEYDTALQMLRGAEKKEIDSEAINAKIVQVLFEKGQYKEAGKLGIELIGQTVPDHLNGFECHVCGFQQIDFFWNCPECGSQNELI